MSKVRITADAVLAIVKGIFEDGDVDIEISDSSCPTEWKGKKISEILNVEYYTFKHRPQNSKGIFEEKMKSDGQANRLLALNRSFCLVSRGTVERLFSKDIDTLVLTPTVEFLVQTNKAPLLDYLIEECNIQTSGIRIPIHFGDETRRAVIFFDSPTVRDIIPDSPYGEVAIVNVDIVLQFYPDVVSYADYEVSVAFNGKSAVTVPLTSFSFGDVRSQKAVSRMGKPSDTGSVSLSRSNTFVLVFDGYANDFVDYITDKAYSDDEQDNNEEYTLNVKRGSTTYSFSVIIKDHQITVNNDTGNELHTLTFVKRGILDGTT